MSGSFGKKQVLLAVMVVALGAAVYLNYYFSVQNPPITDTNASSVSSKTLGEAINVNENSASDQEAVETEETENPDDYFTQARANREAARQQAIDVVKDLMNDAKANDDTQKQALEKTAAIAESIEKESNIESLIKAKGFADCVVYIEEDKCSVVVRSEDLKSNEALQITEIVTEQSGIAAKNVNIVPIK